MSYEYIAHSEHLSKFIWTANMANGPIRGERLQIMLTRQEQVALDDFRFKLRMPSRAAAIPELLRRGLSAGGFEAAAFGTKSEDFGVVSQTPKGRTTNGSVSPKR